MPSKRNEPKILVVGCGSIGRRHARNLAKLGIVDVLVLDLLSVHARAVASQFGFRAVESLAEAWQQKPRIALIATPTDHHIPLALEAARNDCHLFIEKPLSHSLEGVEELCSEIDRRCLTTMVGCNMRFHFGPSCVKKLLNENRIGKVIAARIQTGSYLPGWRPQSDYHQSYSASTVSGGAVLDCIHEIDLTLWYFGAAEVLSSAVIPASSIGLETDGLAEMTLKHDSGVISSVHLNFIQRDYRRGCQIIGDEGTIYWDYIGRRVDLYGPEGTITDTVMQPEGWEDNQMYVDEMLHFLNAFACGEETLNSARASMDALRIAIAVKQGYKSHS